MSYFSNISVELMSMSTVQVIEAIFRNDGGIPIQYLLEELAERPENEVLEAGYC